ncbi:hypothetical protein KIW84_023848 [Lathyrus oleraceus]|uniref:Retrovirus-related Pol polyprotein from transposon TNT 1-94 n=1 Tax=Pisum sativum TaxID=3888 RepID=A0A9D4YE11_PEA|nr:hypothetical protein KIW84_023848 [Pisum sativum]
MVDTYSTTISSTHITFKNVPIKNQDMDLNVDNVLNPNDIVDVDDTERVLENEVDQEAESVEQLVASNGLRKSTCDKRTYVRYPSDEPDIAHVVEMVSLYLSNSGKDHWEVVKWVMEYFCGSSNLKLTLGFKKPMLVRYANSDISGSLDD